VVGNKQDLYSDSDKFALETYLKNHSLHDAQLVFTEQGNIEPSLLAGAEEFGNSEKVSTKTSFNDRREVSEHDHQSLEVNIPECGFIKALNKGDGYVSVGWRFAKHFEFDQNRLFIFLHGIQADRLKATFITNNGSFGYNLTPDALTEIPLEQLDESRIEIITDELNDSWEQGLFNCQINHNVKTTDNN